MKKRKWTIKRWNCSDERRREKRPQKSLCWSSRRKLENSSRGINGKEAMKRQKLHNFRECDKNSGKIVQIFLLRNFWKKCETTTSIHRCVFFSCQFVPLENKSAIISHFARSIGLSLHAACSSLLFSSWKLNSINCYSRIWFKLSWSSYTISYALCIVSTHRTVWISNIHYTQWYWWWNLRKNNLCASVLCVCMCVWNDENIENWGYQSIGHVHHSRWSRRCCCWSVDLQ